MFLCLLRVFSTILVLFASEAIGSPLDASKQRFDWNKMKFLYAFGDSYTFVQGTKGHAKFSFIGDASDFAFTPTDLLSNEIIPKNTSSDGSNWVKRIVLLGGRYPTHPFLLQIEFLTGCLEGHPIDCSPRQLWNFAFAGADIDAKLLPLHHNFTVPLVDQVKQWATYAANVVPHPRGETLTAWWIGINDTGDTLNNATITDWNAFWDQEMSSYFQAVELAHQHGLSGTYLFFNVPPEQRSPAHVNDPTSSAKLQQHIQLYNSILNTYIQSFATEHKDTTVLTFDAYTWFNDILDNAAHYGFKNITGFCQCTDPTFFWYNTGHPTEHVHRLLAQAIEAQLLEVSK